MSVLEGNKIWFCVIGQPIYELCECVLRMDSKFRCSRWCVTAFLDLLFFFIGQSVNKVPKDADVLV